MIVNDDTAARVATLQFYLMVCLCVVSLVSERMLPFTRQECCTGLVIVRVYQCDTTAIDKIEIVVCFVVVPNTLPVSSFPDA
jgi:hypothetical protein